MTRRWLILPLLFAATAAIAEPTPAGIVSYRHAVMGAAGRHMKALGMIAKGEVDRPGDIEAHATALHAASKDLLALFPPGTGPDAHKTEAKAEIWTRWADFEAAAKTFETETAALVAVAKSRDIPAFKAQLGKVGDACGGCHEPFKTKH